MDCRAVDICSSAKRRKAINGFLLSVQVPRGGLEEVCSCGFSWLFSPVMVYVASSGTRYNKRVICNETEDSYKGWEKEEEDVEMAKSACPDDLFAIDRSPRNPCGVRRARAMLS